VNFVEQLTAVTLLVDFFLGVTFGVVGGAVYGSKLEDGERSLLGTAPDAVSAGARRIYGVYSRDDGYMARLLRGGNHAPGSDRDGRQRDDFGAEGKDLER
jgi:hypothetical protein